VVSLKWNIGQILPELINLTCMTIRKYRLISWEYKRVIDTVAAAQRSKGIN